MAFGRRNRPSLLGTAARTAVIAGTATAASNAVNARAATSQAQAAPAPAPAMEAAPMAAPAVGAAPVAGPADDLLSKLERLAALHASGALTDDEFAAVKASIIG